MHSKLNSVARVRERTIPTERPSLVGEVSAKFEDRECRVVSMTDPYGRILGFPDRSRYFFFQVAPQLYSRGWVDPVPDPLLLRKSGSDGNRTRYLWICSQELWPLDHRGGHLCVQIKYEALSLKIKKHTHTHTHIYIYIYIYIHTYIQYTLNLSWILNKTFSKYSTPAGAIFSELNQIDL
jgi:hypothetical protein